MSDSNPPREAFKVRIGDYLSEHELEGLGISADWHLYLSPTEPPSASQYNQQMNAYDLSACPCCGGRATIIGTLKTCEWSAICTMCGLETAHMMQPKDAASAWNKRHAPDEEGAAPAQPAGGGRVLTAKENDVERVAELLKEAGWRDVGDAQWDGLFRAVPDIVHALTQPQPEKAMNEHTDDSAIDRFAAAMKSKMAKQRDKGYGDWDNPAACPAERLVQCLRESVLKGDPVDVGNFAMMLFNRGQKGDSVAPYNVRSTPNPPTALDLERAAGSVSSVSSVVPTTPENEEGDAAETIQRNPKSWEAWWREAERLAALLAERPQAGEVDPALAEFYGVTTVAELLAAQEEHVLKLQDTVRRNVKPWEDTMPPTLLPKYLRDTGLDAAETKVKPVVVYGATPPESGGQGENGVLRVECRQCDECGHAGIDDTTDATACSYCDWRGSDPGEDKCPECNRVGTMTSGCPNCGGRYIFLADADFSHPPAQASGAVTEAMVSNGIARYMELEPEGSEFAGVAIYSQESREFMRELLTAALAQPANGGESEQSIKADAYDMVAEALRDAGLLKAGGSVVDTVRGMATPPESGGQGDYPEFDATDAAHPAWWRGHTHTSKVFCQKVNEILDGKDDGAGMANEPWESTRRRLIALAQGGGNER